MAIGDFQEFFPNRLLKIGSNSQDWQIKVFSFFSQVFINLFPGSGKHFIILLNIFSIQSGFYPVINGFAHFPVPVIHQAKLPVKRSEDEFPDPGFVVLDVDHGYCVFKLLG
jgi:hypothetical protein